MELDIPSENKLQFHLGISPRKLRPGEFPDPSAEAFPVVDVQNLDAQEDLDYSSEGSSSDDYSEDENKTPL